MVEYIRNNKFLFLIICILICYIIVCNICANLYYHLNGDEKVEKVVVKDLKQQEVIITSEDIIEKVNRQYHIQLLFSSGMGVFKHDSQKSLEIAFYNENDEKIKGFTYNPKTKRLYPGELQLPKKTEMVMDEVVNYT